MTATVFRVDCKTLIEALRPYLPYSLPLYRRLQSPYKGNDHHILATPLPRPKSEDLDSACFAAAYVERQRVPRAEGWIFLSCEAPFHRSQSAAEEALCSTCTDRLLAIVREISNIPAPAAVDTSESIETNARFLTHAFDPSLLLLGSLNASIALFLRGRGWLSNVHPGLNRTYLKYIFERESIPLTITDDLPEGLRWGEVREQDLELAQARTDIPRPASALRNSPSIAIFPIPTASQSELNGAPIAWAFIGIEGSLITLHVEEEYRGRGLAKKLAAKLFRTTLPEAFDIAGEQRGGYGHADVAPANASSRAVCRSVGGKNVNEWQVCWTRLDIDKVRTSLSEQLYK